MGDQANLIEDKRYTHFSGSLWRVEDDVLELLITFPYYLVDYIKFKKKISSGRQFLFVRDTASKSPNELIAVAKIIYIGGVLDNCGGDSACIKIKPLEEHASNPFFSLIKGFEHGNVWKKNYVYSMEVSKGYSYDLRRIYFDLAQCKTSSKD